MYGKKHLVYRSNASTEEVATIRRWVKHSIDMAPSGDLRPPNLVHDAVVRRGQLAKWIHIDGGGELLRCLRVQEVERGMGFPVGSTAIPADASREDPDEAIWARHNVLGNAFAVDAIEHVLRPLDPVFTGIGPAPPSRDLSALPTSKEAVFARLRPQSAVVHPSGNGAR